MSEKEQVLEGAGISESPVQKTATRIRRGKTIEIPPKWIGKFPTAKTMRNRPSKMIGKLKRKIKGGAVGSYKDGKDKIIFISED